MRRIETKFRLLQHCCQIIDLRRTFLVVQQKVYFNGSSFRGLAVLSAFNNQTLVILSQIVIIHETEQRLQPGLLEELQLQRLSNIAARLSAECLNESCVPIRYVVIKMKFIGCQVTLDYCLADPLHFVTRNDFSIENAAEVFLNFRHS